MLSSLPPQRGVRFAPSPTGRFHLGNLRTAWISHLWARALNQPWVLRFEDIDAPRVLPGARESQIEDMKALGLEADEVLTQSEFHSRHWEVFARAIRERRVYPCFCSRKEVREALEGAASAPHRAQAIYSGRCRALGGCPPRGEGELPSLGWRFALDEEPSGRHDFIVARSGTRLDSQGLPEPSTFVPSYHWACAIDDWDGRYLLLVRAADLADVATLHRAIMAWLARSESRALEFPAVFHAALVTQDDGHRLEKRTRGVTLPELRERDVSESALLERFERSFGLDPSEFSPGRIWGEAKTSLKLSEIGLVDLSRIYDVR